MGHFQILEDNERAAVGGGSDTPVTPVPVVKVRVEARKMNQDGGGQRETGDNRPPGYETLRRRTDVPTRARADNAVLKFVDNPDNDHRHVFSQSGYNITHAVIVNITLVVNIAQIVIVNITLLVVIQTMQHLSPLPGFPRPPSDRVLLEKSSSSQQRVPGRLVPVPGREQDGRILHLGKTQDRGES